MGLGLRAHGGVQRGARGIPHSIWQLRDYIAARPGMGRDKPLYGGRRNRRALQSEQNYRKSRARAVKHNPVWVERSERLAYRPRVGRQISFDADAIRTLHTRQDSGEATRFGDDDIPVRSGVRPSVFGSNIFNAVGIAAHDRRLFMVDATQDAFYVLDRSRGVASRVGNLTISSGRRVTNPSGLATVREDLYVSSVNPNALYKVNPSTGSTTWSKTLALDTITGIAWDGSKMYAIDDATDALYTIIGIQEPAAINAQSFPFLPDEGDLYYNGDVIRPGFKHSYTFVDSVFRWNSPSWTHDDNDRGNPCDRAVTYEHDLEINNNWIRADLCTTWSTFDDGYDDCSTAGLLDPTGKTITSFGIYKAPDVTHDKLYYGTWKFSSIGLPSHLITDVRLMGQEGFYRIPIDTLLGKVYVRCRIKIPWCIGGIEMHQIDLISNIRWTRGVPSYTTFRRR